ncbi:MAG: hypothetical protein JJ975_01495 [Bacteroidia bacterium]|nr:hypothetical protein [Bacteroidia bacterium]
MKNLILLLIASIGFSQPSLAQIEFRITGHLIARKGVKPNHTMIKPTSGSVSIDAVSMILSIYTPKRGAREYVIDKIERNNTSYIYRCEDADGELVDILLQAGTGQSIILVSRRNSNIQHIYFVT